MLGFSDGVKESGNMEGRRRGESREMDKNVRKLLEQFTRNRSSLLPMLQKVQETDEYISPETIREISRFLDISENEIYSVASFYSRFRFTRPDGQPLSAAQAQEEIARCELSVLRPGEVRIALRNAGHIDPENIHDYIAREGYSGLAKALKMTPEEVIEEVSRSGLRGRGGAGFSTAEKWRSCREAEGTEKYLICNAAEGDPGACTNRILLENDPHAVLEGILIAAYATGAGHGLIYVNAESVLALSRLKTALKQMEEHKLFGDAIQGSDFNFHIEVVERPHAFACGEETALIRSLEGKRSVPYPRPPFPAVSGFQGKPTVVNNAETLAHVSAILQKGPEWFASHGSGQSKGTKILTLAGNVMRPGVVEVPMGMTLRQIIYEIGEGILQRKDFKAVQTGGPTGGWLPANALDLPFDYEHLTAAGSIMGSGSMIVADSSACAVDLAKHSLFFLQAESCGKCVFCREGTIQMAEILTDISEGRGRPHDIDLLLKLGAGMKLGALCALGRTAPNPVLTTITHFRGEYEAHIKEMRCPAGVCENLQPSFEAKA
jgi:NADH:ubiquinone oxidoreductase subunit F (NADH-binding)